MSENTSSTPRHAAPSTTPARPKRPVMGGLIGLLALVFLWSALTNLASEPVYALVGFAIGGLLGLLAWKIYQGLKFQEGAFMRPIALTLWSLVTAGLVYAGFTENPAALLGAVLTALYVRYIWRGGRILFVFF